MKNVQLSKSTVAAIRSVAQYEDEPDLAKRAVLNATRVEIPRGVLLALCDSHEDLRGARDVWKDGFLQVGKMILGDEKFEQIVTILKSKSA